MAYLARAVITGLGHDRFKSALKNHNISANKLMKTVLLEMLAHVLTF